MDSCDDPTRPRIRSMNADWTIGSRPASISNQFINHRSSLRNSRMPTPRELLDRLDTRHDELIRKLDELNAQIETALAQFGKSRSATATTARCPGRRHLGRSAGSSPRGLVAPTVDAAAEFCRVPLEQNSTYGSVLRGFSKFVFDSTAELLASRLVAGGWRRRAGRILEYWNSFAKHDSPFQNSDILEHLAQGNPVTYSVCR